MTAQFFHFFHFANCYSVFLIKCVAYYYYYYYYYYCVDVEVSMLGVFLVTTAWSVVRLWMEESPPDTDGICEYIEQAVAAAGKR